MSAPAVSLSGTSTAIDLTSGTAYGTNALKNLGSGLFGMWSADATANSLIDAADRVKIWNNRDNSNYRQSDVNMDGEADAADRTKVWDNRNVVGQVPK